MKKFGLIVLILCFCSTWQGAFALQDTPSDNDGDVRYVSDDLFIFMHSGPGRNYRILGSVQAGTPLNVLQVDEENAFMEVIDDTQRTGWVETKFVTATPSMRQQLPELQSELQQVNQTLAMEKRNNTQLSQQVNQLSQKNAELEKQTSQLMADNQRMEQSLAMQDKSEQMQWLMRGGGIAVLGMIVGVIVAYLPKKRRRNDQWM